MVPVLLTSIKGTSGPQYTTMIRVTSGPLVIAPYREIADRRSPVDNHVYVDLRAPDECPMYGCGGPQGPQFTIMYRRTPGPLVNV